MVTICHLTTAHPAGDPRIYQREILSISENISANLIYASNGNFVASNINFDSLGDIPKNRISRFLRSQVVPFKLLFKYKVDIWHLHDLELAPFAILLCKLNKTVIWDAHEDYFEQFKPEISHRDYIPKFIRRAIAIFIKLLLKSLDKNCTAIVVATEEIKRKYRNSQTVLVGNETKIEVFENCRPNIGFKTALFTGAMSKQQCFREIVMAVASTEDMSLIVAGREISTELKFATEALGNRFEYVGYLDPAKLSELLNRVSFGLVTYEDSPIYATNRSNKFYEFAAAGLPIVATPTGANIELIASSKGGVTAIDFSVQSIKKAMELVISDQHNWKEMSENNRKWVIDNGNWKHSESRLLNLYSKLIIKVLD